MIFFFQCLDRPVWKGLLRIAMSIIHGLELAVTTATIGGMASAFYLLEIAHTHYWQREPLTNKIGTSAVREGILPGFSQDYFVIVLFP